MTARTADVAVIGGGLIGRAVALACVRRGLSVTLFDTREPGESSPAGAGMLAPITEGADSPATRLFIAGRDLWPAYLAALAELSPVPVALSRAGIIALSHDDAEASAQRAPAPGQPHWQGASALAELEAGLVAPLGGVLHLLDGAVDNVALLRALDHALDHAALHAPSTDRRLTRAGPAAGVERTAIGPTAGVRVRTRDGQSHDAASAVVAAGAWSPHLTGLPRTLPIEPVRGEMIGFPVAVTSRCIYGPGAYVVPRPGGRTIVGATMDRVGFDPTTTATARRSLHEAVAAFLPALTNVEPDSHWAGLRPVTPDFLPIMGPDPDWPALIHATGHSRNGILLAPMTAAAVADWVTGKVPAWDLTPFRPDRFK